jgi:hypothetical protein
VLGVRRWRELVIDRKKIERYYSTGQRPQWAVAPTEEEEELCRNAHLSKGLISYTGQIQVILYFKHI